MQAGMCDVLSVENNRDPVFLGRHLSERVSVGWPPAGRGNYGHVEAGGGWLLSLGHKFSDCA